MDHLSYVYEIWIGDLMPAFGGSSERSSLFYL
jgi:hypothetical protein